MLNNRQKLILRELERIINKASTALELLDKHIPQEHKLMKLQHKLMKLQHKLMKLQHKLMKPPSTERYVFTVAGKIAQMQWTAKLIQEVLKGLRLPDTMYLEEQEKTSIYTLRINLEKMKQYNPAHDLLLLKEEGNLTQENFIASYGLKSILSKSETTLAVLQSMAISVARAIGYVIDCLFNLVASIGKTIATGDIQFVGTYNREGETPFALATTGHFQFFPNQSKNLHGIVEELNKAYDIFVEEFGTEDHGLYNTTYWSESTLS